MNNEIVQTWSESDPSALAVCTIGFRTRESDGGDLVPRPVRRRRFVRTVAAACVGLFGVSFAACGQDGGSSSENVPASFSLCKTPPIEVADSWSDLLELANVVAEERVVPADVDDQELLRRGVIARQIIDAYGAQTPCGPDGLAADFGCADEIQACAEQLLAGDVSTRFGTPAVLEVIWPAGMD